MPLAIELAAARVGLLTDVEILTQLSDRFRLLKGGDRTAPARLQTLATTIDWSYRLLSGEEAILFRRLSVFRGGFTLEAAQSVCGESIAGTAFDLIAALVQKSMVVAERTEHSGSRYRLLESQLAYAEERLRDAGELELIRGRHFEFFRVGLAARTDHLALWQAGLGDAKADWKVLELGNLWAAVEWARTKS